MAIRVPGHERTGSNGLSVCILDEAVEALTRSGTGMNWIGLDWIGLRVKFGIRTQFKVVVQGKVEKKRS